MSKKPSANYFFQSVFFISHSSVFHSTDTLAQQTFPEHLSHVWDSSQLLIINRRRNTLHLWVTTSVGTTHFAATPKSPVGNKQAGGSDSSSDSWLARTDRGGVCRLVLLHKAHQYNRPPVQRERDCSKQRHHGYHLTIQWGSTLWLLSLCTESDNTKLTTHCYWEKHQKHLQVVSWFHGCALRDLGIFTVTHFTD